MIVTLVAKNPQAPQNIVRFDHTTGEYVNVKLSESMIDHLEIESTCLHKDSAEAKKQMQGGGGSKNGRLRAVMFHFFYIFGIRGGINNILRGKKQNFLYK